MGFSTATGSTGIPAGVSAPACAAPIGEFAITAGADEADDVYMVLAAA